MQNYQQQPPQGQGFIPQAQGWAQQQVVAYQQRREQAQQQAQAAYVASGQQVARTYRDQGHMQHDMQQMARQGYRVASQSAMQPRSGCMRTICLGFIGAMIWKPKPVFTVTYTRG